MSQSDRTQHVRCTVPRAVVFMFVIALGLASPSAACAEVRAADRVDGLSRGEIGIPKAAMPDVDMKAGMLVSADGRALWARRPTDRRAIASITKIMTAIIVLENTDPGATITVPKASTSVGESTSFLRTGEKLPVYEVLEALLVKSGNDAAVALATHVAGGEEEFVTLMNSKARDLGLERTRFSNPHGLDSGDNYSTAEDVAVLSRYAMSKATFRAIVGQKHAFIGTGSRSERVESTNLLLGNFAGANGVKTGWTSDAGYCVVDSARRGGVELYAVVLGTSGELSRFRDARELLDFGFAHYRSQRLVSAGSVIGEAPVADYLNVTVPAAVSKDSTVTVFDLAGEISRSVTVASVKAPVQAGDKVGVATFTQRGEVIATVPLVATRDVPRPSVFERIGIALVRAWRGLAGGRD